jgi:peroxiredoxin
LQKDLPTLLANKIKLIAISFDSVEVLARFAKQQKITFPLLSDPGSKIIAEYGLTNKEAKGKAEGVPYPGTMLIDQDGVIRAKLFREGYRERHAGADIINAIARIK